MEREICTGNILHMHFPQCSAVGEFVPDCMGVPSKRKGGAGPCNRESTCGSCPYECPCQSCHARTCTWFTLSLMVPIENSVDS